MQMFKSICAIVFLYFWNTVHCELQHLQVGYFVLMGSFGYFDHTSPTNQQVTYTCSMQPRWSWEFFRCKSCNTIAREQWTTGQLCHQVSQTLTLSVVALHD